MPLETDCRFQKAIYWAKSTYDNYGNPDITTPAEELDVRWEDVSMDILDPQGNSISIDAVVVVDRVIAVGSVMWKGSLSDIGGTSELPDGDFLEVVKYSSIPDIKARYYRRLVYLKRLNDTLPVSS